MIVAYAIMITTTIDISGELAMVTARFLGNKFVKPIIEKHKAEGRAEGLAEGRTEGKVEGRAVGLAEERHRWVEWNRRRMDAQATGAPFDEQPPGS